MKLDRNITNPKRGKYALIKLRDAELRVVNAKVSMDGTIKPAAYEISSEHIDFGDTDDSDFFVIRLKDRYATAALTAYAEAASHDDPEYASEINALAMKSALHPNRRIPD